MSTVIPTPSTVENAVAISAQADVLDLAAVRIDPAWAMRVPMVFAQRKRLLPLCRLEQTVIVAAVDTPDAQTLKHLRGYLKHDFTIIKASRDSMRRALAKVYEPPAVNVGNAESPSQDGASPSGREGNETVVACDEILQAAVLRGASDIHLVPTATTLHAQLRVDGQLELFKELPAHLQSGVINRLKVLAGLDIAEKRAAQDGRITSRSGSDNKVDIRVATLPTRYGERMTLRLLTPPDSKLNLSALGMRERDLEVFTAATSRPHGLVLLTGPTGSGKSTTLYVAIDQLMRTRGGNVITIEDPIEYEIQGASQVEVDAADKVNFSKALRSVLRHDPDVVMIGEIRDAETASIAVKASLTGHLVFSTLHTNTAAGVVTRLSDMGIEPFLIAATIRLSVAQRLVRKLCAHCRKPRPMTRTEAQSLKQPQLENQTVYDPGGCLYCAGRGYTGRVALFEMLESSEELSQAIASGAGEDELTALAKKNRMTALFEDGLAKIADGTTTVSEVASAVITW